MIDDVKKLIRAYRRLTGDEAGDRFREIAPGVHIAGAPEALGELERTRRTITDAFADLERRLNPPPRRYGRYDR